MPSVPLLNSLLCDAAWLGNFRCHQWQGSKASHKPQKPTTRLPGATIRVSTVFTAGSGSPRVCCAHQASPARCSSGARQPSQSASSANNRRRAAEQAPAGAGSWYGKGGSKTLAHPDFDCITRWWHPWRNGGSRPTNFTHGSEKRVWLQCDGCPRCGDVHEWDARVATLTNSKAAHGIVCPFCDSRSKLIRFCSCRSIAADSRLLQEWHPYNPDPATVALASNLQKYTWRCTAGRGHADYEATPGNRSTHGTGCPACWKEQHRKFSHGSLAEQRPDLAAEWVAARNGGPPGQLTCGSGIRAWWRCSHCGHSWQTEVATRALEGGNCPRCRERNRMKPRVFTRHKGSASGDEA